MTLNDMRLLIKDCDDFLKGIEAYMDKLDGREWARASDCLDHHRATLEIHLENISEEVLEWERED